MLVVVLVGVFAGPAVASAADLPTGLTAAAIDGAVDLSWQPAAGASAYNVYRGLSAGTTTTAITPPGGVVLPGFKDTTVVNGSTYYYVVKPIVLGVESGVSLTVKATPRARPCPTGNAVVLENCYPGDTGWKVTAAAAPAAGGIEGFATSTSINQGGAVSLKVNGGATTTFHVDIYRAGYYDGEGARLISSISGIPGKTQPACASDATTGLTDCSNWSTSATLTTTASWPSGVYMLHVVRDDNGRDTEILVVVRDDSSTADLMFGLPFTTYAAYNEYGGKSLYDFNSTGANTIAGSPRAVKVSLDRPFQQVVSGQHDWFTATDQAWVSWLEESGYDVTYASDVDLETAGALPRAHKTYLLGSHDEYYSAAMRTSLEQARDAGVNLFVAGANAVYWKIRFESSASGAANRVVVCYKSTASGGPDPSGIPTGTWRDPAGANKPENALLGEMYVGDNAGRNFPIVVSAQQGQDRVFRSTGLGTTSTSIGSGLVGWEWDARVANGAEPPGVVTLATSPVNGNLIQNNGQSTTTGSTNSNMTKYTASSGALVFDTGTMNWVLGLDTNGAGVGEVNPIIRQTTTNVLQDMGTKPQTPITGVTLDAPAAPTVTGSSPRAGETNVSTAVTITATFSKGMNAATITSSSFTVTPQGSSTPVSATTAYDPSTQTARLTLNTPLAVSTVYNINFDGTVKATDGSSLAAGTKWSFTTSSTLTPLGSTVRIDAGAGTAYVASDGRLFQADGLVAGGSTNTSTATITGTNDPKLYQSERWGQFTYTIPVQNATYDVTLHFAELYYTSGSCVGKRIFGIDITNTALNPDVANLDICAAAGGANKALIKKITGVQVTNGTLTLKSVYGSADDPQITAIEITPASAPTGPPTVVSQTPASGASNVATSTTVTAGFSKAMDPSTITASSFTLKKLDGTPVPATVSYDSASATATLTPSSALALSTTYTASLATTIRASDGQALQSPVSWSFSTAATAQPLSTVRINAGGGAYTTTDGRAFAADQSFTGGGTDASAATITGTSDPALYRDERWGNFTYAIPVVNGTYDVALHFVELYYTSGSCVGKRIFSMDVTNTVTSPDIANLDVCASAGGANKALVRIVSGVTVTNGVLTVKSVYGSVDDPELAAIEVTPSSVTPGPPTVSGKTPTAGAVNVAVDAKATATFSTAMDPSTINSSSFTLKKADGTAVGASVAYDAPSATATLTPTAALATSTTYTATLAATIKSADGQALQGAPVTWSFTTAATTQTLSTVRINTGGGAYTTADGRTFLADQYFTGGAANTVATAIAGTPDPTLYQTERWGNFSYAIPVVNGTYDVTLHFAELFYTSGSCIGKRVFSIDVTQTSTNPDLPSLDVCAAAGGALKAYVKTITGVQATNGLINVKSVYGTADDPEIVAIEVTPSNSQPQPGSTPQDIGAWSAPQDWPLVTVHASLLPTGNVLVFDGFAAAPNSQRVWNPTSGTFTPVPYAVNIFCAGHIDLPDGRVMIAGGHVQADVGLPDTSIFNPSTGTWTAAQQMSVARWYPTVTELGDGRALVFSGDNIVQDRPGATPPFSDASVNSLPEVFDPKTGTYTDLTGSRLTAPLYPFLFVLSDGRVLDAGPDTTTRILDPATWQWSTIGTSPFDGMSAVMYRPNKIMKSGSWADPDWNGTAHPLYDSRADTGVLDMNAPSPAWRTTAPMHFPRSYQNLTMLPDGTVLASGGMATSDGVDITKAVLPAEIWNPDTETWKTVAPLSIGREYHSTALLLPDGRVLMAGGGQLPGSLAVNQTNAEIYSPPYLYQGARPTISSAPSIVQYGSSFTVQTPDAAGISKVSLVKLPSVTHGLDMNQRFQFLNFTAGAGQLNVTAPANSNLAPPGYYMLFVVNGNGVPSVASMIRFPAPWEDTVAPTAPTNLTATAGSGQISLAWQAATDTVGVTAYDVYRSTSNGFTPSAANRVARLGNVLSYTDTGLAAGTYYYRVQAEDAAGNLGPSSNQASATVAPSGDTTAPTVSITAPTAGATVSGSVSVTANAADNVGVTGVQFKLDGANLGTEDVASPYSTSWDTTAVANGAHSLTAVARDAAGNTTTSVAVSVTVSNVVPPATGLVAAYNFDAGSGTTLADRSGTGNNGTIANGTWSTTGHAGGALSFNGTNSWVTVPDANSLDLTTGMTLEAWVNPNQLGTAWRTVLFKEQPGEFVYSLYANQNTTRPIGQIFLGGEQNATGTAALPLNAWTHLAVTFDGSNLRLYVNGTLVQSVAVIGSLPVSTGVLHIGGNAVWGEWYRGLIDDVRIYNKALTASQIQSDMAAPVP